ATLTDPSRGLHRFSYDALGRLTRDQDPAGGSSTLARTDAPDGYTVTLTTAEGQVSTFQIQNLPDGRQRRINTPPAGHAVVTVYGTDGTETTTDPDGTVTTLTYGPDPRFGMQAPVVSATRTTPGGVKTTLTATRTASLSDPSNPLSLETLTESVSL